MKAYFFTNIMLSPTQFGVQSVHTLGEMNNKYHPDAHYVEPGKDVVYQPTRPAEILSEWQTQHKTVVFVDGGFQSDLEELLAFLDQGGNFYPYAHFCESQKALNGAMTNVGLIATERLLAGREAMRLIMRLPRTDFSRQTFEETGTLQVEYEGTTLAQETFTPFEIELMKRLDRAKLAR